MENRKINLIPFTSLINNDAVYKMITGIGYNVDIVRSDNWLNSKSYQPRNISVFLFDKEILTQDKLRIALIKKDRSPTFAIINNLKIN